MPMQLPQEPTGMPVGTYNTYESAQRAVDYLADHQFPVQHITIVGKDLRLVERVVGRLTTSKAAAMGAGGGALWGLFIGAMIMLFASTEGGAVLVLPFFSAAFGAGLGAVMGGLGHAMSGGRRDFSSRTSVVPTSYEILCQHQHAEDARNLLARLALRG